MPYVKFRVPFVVDGTRYRKGVQRVSKDHMDRLPSSAHVMSREDVAEYTGQELPPEPKEVVRPKQFRGIPNEFSSESGANIPKDEAIKSAVALFTSGGGTVGDWNDLADKERRQRIEAAANEILATI